jgi:hypothetical protein
MFNHGGHGGAQRKTVVGSVFLVSVDTEETCHELFDRGLG